MTAIILSAIMIVVFFALMIATANDSVSQIAIVFMVLVVIAFGCLMGSIAEYRHPHTKVNGGHKNMIAKHHVPVGNDLAWAWKMHHEDFPEHLPAREAFKLGIEFEQARQAIESVQFKQDTFYGFALHALNRSRVQTLVDAHFHLKLDTSGTYGLPEYTWATVTNLVPAEAGKTE